MTEIADLPEPDVEAESGTRSAVKAPYVQLSRRAITALRKMPEHATDIYLTGLERLGVNNHAHWRPNEPDLDEVLGIKPVTLERNIKALRDAGLLAEGSRAPSRRSGKGNTHLVYLADQVGTKVGPRNTDCDVTQTAQVSVAQVPDPGVVTSPTTAPEPVQAASEVVEPVEAQGPQLPTTEPEPEPEVVEELPEDVRRLIAQIEATADALSFNALHKAHAEAFEHPTVREAGRARVEALKAEDDAQPVSAATMVASGRPEHRLGLDFDQPGLHAADAVQFLTWQYVPGTEKHRELAERLGITAEEWSAHHATALAYYRGLAG